MALGADSPCSPQVPMQFAESRRVRLLEGLQFLLGGLMLGVQVCGLRLDCGLRVFLLPGRRLERGGDARLPLGEFFIQTRVQGAPRGVVFFADSLGPRLRERPSLRSGVLHLRVHGLGRRVELLQAREGGLDLPMVKETRS